MIHFWIWLKSQLSDIWGVTAYDYAAGNPNLMGCWTGKDWDAFEAVRENVLTNGHDGVYLFCYKQGNNRGWFEVLSSNGKSWGRVFWDRQYYCAEAYRDAILKCREFAHELGFHLPTDDPGSDIKP